MPKPNPIRDKFLKYLRGNLAHDMPWYDVSGIYFARDVRVAVKQVAHTDPMLYRILHAYITTRNSRMEIARAVSFDSSTVKRKLDEAADIVLQNLKLDATKTSEG